MVAPGGVCVVAPRGCAWLLLGEGVCVVTPGGVCMVATGGACVVAQGRVWLLRGACVVALGGVCGCSGGACVGYDEIRRYWSMSGRYASYWNAFLFHIEAKIRRLIFFPFSCISKNKNQSIYL